MNGSTRRVTVNEVVELTGLSRATVDRVLNERAGVHPGTREKVREAYARLATAEADEKIVSAKPSKPAVPADAVIRVGRGLLEQLMYACERKQLPIHIHDKCLRDDDENFETIRRFCRESDRPLIVAVKNNERLCDELITARQRGKRVVTIASDLDPRARDVYVGIDNRQAGQTAALLVGRLLGGQPRKVGVIVGDYAFRCHEDREIGFRAYLRTAFPEIVLADVAKGEDSPEQTRRATLDIFTAHPDIAAVYNIGAGNRGLGSALEELGRGSDVVVIAHEINRITIPLLKNGTIDFLIAQDPGAMLDAAARAAAGFESPVSQHVFIDFGVYCRFNVPAFQMVDDAGTAIALTNLSRTS
jgi:LacI family transcriptional regulator